MAARRDVVEALGLAPSAGRRAPAQRRGIERACNALRFRQHLIRLARVRLSCCGLYRTTEIASQWTSRPHAQAQGRKHPWSPSDRRAPVRARGAAEHEYRASTARSIRSTAATWRSSTSAAIHHFLPLPPSTVGRCKMFIVGISGLNSLWQPSQAATSRSPAPTKPALSFFSTSWSISMPMPES